MAQIGKGSDTTVMRIREFLGLNESEDGETTLSAGELSEMNNFKITKERHLQIRPGTKCLIALYDALEEILGEDTPAQEDVHLRGVWYGNAGGSEHILAAYGSFIWDIFPDTQTVRVLGLCADAETHFFGFDGNVYLIDGTNYKVWDGGAATQFTDVIGYVPLVLTAATPAGKGQVVENINRLNGKRRVKFSPDGSAMEFLLPEAPITSVDGVDINGSPAMSAAATTTISGGTAAVSNQTLCIQRLRSLGGGGIGNYVLTWTAANKWSITIGGRTWSGYTNLAATFGLTVTGELSDGDTVTIVLSAAWTANTTTGKVTFNTAPASGTETVEIFYTNGSGQRSEVLAMKHSELFNGSTDSRVFLYGDGSNKTIYSGIRYDTGLPSAEYFPDLYEIAVGEANTPLTGLIRHYSRMMAFKPSSAWSIQYGTIELESEQVTAAFYCTPVNRLIGNDAPGQVRLLENSPITVDSGSIYQWKGSSSYVTTSEANAKRISDKVIQTMHRFSAESVKTFNIKRDYEFWFLSNGQALILNYAADAWYFYSDLVFDELIERESDLIGICDDGRVVDISRGYRNDDGENIYCFAATGSMDFGRDWMRKYIPMLFVAMMPERNARITVTAQTNKRSDYDEKIVAYNLATFFHMNFKHLSFGTNLKPQVKKVKLKVKKATFYKLVFKSDSASATATIIEADIKLRYSGTVK